MHCAAGRLHPRERSTQDCAVSKETLGHGEHTPRRLHIFGPVDLGTDEQEYCGSGSLMQTGTALVVLVEPSDGIEATAR